MKKRLLSVLLCLCMVVGLMPATTLATDEDGDALQMTYVSSIDEIPSDYQGMVMILEEQEWGSILGYKVRIGTYNSPQAGSYAVELCYDNQIVRLANPTTGGNSLNFSSATKHANYISDMLIDASNDEFGLLSEVLVGGSLSILACTPRKPDETAPNTAQIYQYNVNTSTAADLSSIVKDVVVDGYKWTTPRNKFVEFSSVYFKLQAGKTRTDFVTETIKLFPGSTCNWTGAGTFIGDTFSTNGALMVGFPEPPETEYDVKFTVKANTVPMSGAEIVVNGTSTKNTTITDRKGTTEADGTATISLPAGQYTYTIKDAVVDGKTYSMRTSDRAGVPLTISASQTVATYTNMEEVKASYPIRIKAVNASGNEVALTGATLKFGALTVDAGNISGNTASFTTGSTMSQELTLSGVSGYQNITAGTANVVVTAQTMTAATLSLGTMNSPAATVSIESDATGQYINLILKKAVTDVTLPVPVPEDMSKDQADQIKVTVTPSKDAPQDLKDELGPNGITLTAPDDVKVTVGSDGKPDVTVTAGLPDGTYEIQVGGTGLENTKPITVTVITDNTVTPPKRVVNVGGEVSSSGGSTTITGGVTGSAGGAGNSDAETGNGSIDLTGGQPDTTVTEGGSTTVAPGGAVTTPNTGDAGVTDLTDSGVLGSDTVSDSLKPTPMTDPMYEIDVTPNYAIGSMTEIESFKVDIYLKNAAGTSGTFGMYYDPVVFNQPTGVTLSEGLAFGPSIPSNRPNAEITSSYLTFKWQVTNLSGKPLDGITSGRVKVAELQLPVKTENIAVARLKTLLDDHSIHTQSFTMTQAYQDMVTAATVGGTLNQEVLNESLWSVWRPVGAKGATPSVHLSDDKATRGGFYQYYTNATATDEENKIVELGTMAHDIWMQFNLPKELFGNLRIDFWVTESDGGPGVNGATITVYDTEADAKAGTNGTTATTDASGYAHVSKQAGTYYYTVTDSGHWDFPTGKANREPTDPLYDTVELTETAVTPTVAQVKDSYVNPIMDPKTFHEVELIGTPSPAASITSPKTAYNTVRYYFSIDPNAGQEWNVGTGNAYADMAALAAAITAVRYDVDKTGADLTAAFRTSKAAEPTVAWDTTREMFYIEKTDVTGDAIGIETLTDGATTVNPLRAGDITLELPSNALKTASYTVKAIAGNGGQVKYSGTGSVTTDGTSNATVGTNYSTLVQTLTGETESVTFTFTPDAGGYTIDKVMVNGVAQTINNEQKKNGFDYQFTGVNGDQEIYVTFLNPDGTPASDAYLSVDVGANGSVKVQGKDDSGADATPNDTVQGPGSETYQIGDGVKELEVTITPKDDSGTEGGKQYEIDTILLDGNPYDKGTPNGTTNGYTDPIIIPADKLPTDDGQTHSLVVTFKPVGEPRTHVIVTASVAGGSGKLAPVGQDIYPVGSTPTYTMTPSEHWTIYNKGSVQVETAGKTEDKSADVVAGAGNTFTYTLPALTDNVTLSVTFQETLHEVQGKIRLVAPQSIDVVAAKLTFTRAAVPGQTDELILTQDSGTSTVSLDASFSVVGFTVKLPAGKWTVKVEKQGYLNYTVEQFEIDPQANNVIYFGDAACNKGLAAGEASKVVPIPMIPGDANGEGIAIAFNDAAVVVAGWINGALDINKRKGDINESNLSSGGASDVSDMSLVLQNMSKGRETVDYVSGFCALGAST